MYFWSACIHCQLYGLSGVMVRYVIADICRLEPSGYPPINLCFIHGDCYILQWAHGPIYVHMIGSRGHFGSNQSCSNRRCSSYSFDLGVAWIVFDFRLYLMPIWVWLKCCICRVRSINSPIRIVVAYRAFQWSYCHRDLSLTKGNKITIHTILTHWLLLLKSVSCFGTKVLVLFGLLDFFELSRFYT